MSESGVVTPWSAQLTLEETVQRLQSNDRVRAIDFDLCILLRDYAPGHGVEATIVDGRITDVVVIGANHAFSLGRPTGDVGDEALGDVPSDVTVSDPDAITWTEWPYVRWLAQSRPVYDPDGLGRRARDVAKQLTAGKGSIDREWQQITRSFLTHDLRVSAASLQRVDDPIVRVALGMRQLHTFAAAVKAWFTARGLHRGLEERHRPAGRRRPGLLRCDRALASGQRCRGTARPLPRAVLRALAPIGGPLPVGTVLPQDQEVWERLTNG